MSSFFAHNLDSVDSWRRTAGNAETAYYVTHKSYNNNITYKTMTEHARCVIILLDALSYGGDSVNYNTWKRNFTWSPSFIMQLDNDDDDYY